jgi:hypothetical protein
MAGTALSKTVSGTLRNKLRLRSLFNVEHMHYMNRAGASREQLLSIVEGLLECYLNFVDVTPGPVFAGLERSHDGMVSSVKMLCSVLVSSCAQEGMFFLSRTCQIAMHESDGHSAFTDCRCAALHRTVANVAGCEKAGPVRLQIVRSAVKRPAFRILSRFEKIGTSKNVAVRVP